MRPLVLVLIVVCIGMVMGQSKKQRRRDSSDSDERRPMRRCRANEVFRRCGTACEPTCNNPNPLFCSTRCVRNVCECKKGFVRNNRNRCVRRRNCPRKTPATCRDLLCPPGSICHQDRVDCIRAPCPQPPPVCISVPNPILTCATIRCSPGFVCVQEKINCIRAPCPQPQPKCVPIAQPPVTCANLRCRPGTVCVEPTVNCNRPPCSKPPAQCVPIGPTNPCTFTTCAVGSVCRVKTVNCRRPPCNQVAECVPSRRCGRNEFFDECGGCDKTCFDRNKVCPAVCLKGKCICAPGYYRFQGRCIPARDCPIPLPIRLPHPHSRNP